MTCDECDEIQKTLSSAAFVRVENSNVMVVGCHKHVKILLDRYNRP